MKFIASLLLVSVSQAMRVSRELPAAPAFPTDDNAAYTSSELDTFKTDVEKAKIDSHLYQVEHQGEVEKAKQMTE